MTDQNINVNATALIDPLYAALIVNAWYSAQSLHLTKHGSLTENDKTKLLADIFDVTLRVQQSYRQKMDQLLADQQRA